MRGQARKINQGGMAMVIYTCSVCGYVYDPAAGSPESGVAPGTAWEALPADWVCPVCGAEKSAFKPGRAAEASAGRQPAPAAEAAGDDEALSALETAALCRNLARGCEKQYKPEESGLFRELAAYFSAGVRPAEPAGFGQLAALAEEDLKTGFAGASAAAAREKDRGALRALVWGEKVTRMQKSHLDRREKEGPEAFEGAELYVCTICGFIFAGDKPPEICPVCKVPGWKFEKIEGRQ